MKLFALFMMVAVAANLANADLTCSLGSPKNLFVDENRVPLEGIALVGNCLTEMKNQIQMEINASYQYLAMGAHFSIDTVNRPGFAEHFFKAAREERDHGAKLIEYLSMRGHLTNDVSSLLKVPVGLKATKWESGLAALEDALQLEFKVTTSIRELIKTCEKEPNYYHLVDYLTGVYLEEQLHGQRELAGKISTLSKMMKTNGDALEEFLFDKNM